MLPYTLLGLLSHYPRHGYDLKNAIEQALGGRREINFGQIYTTLSRLERDGLVTASEAEDGRGKRNYQITPKGREELEAWLNQTVKKNEALQDEFIVKLIVRYLAGYGDALEIVARQRQTYLQQLQTFTSLASEEKDNEPVVALLLEGAMLHLQADLRLLDLCDEQLEKLDKTFTKRL